MKQGLNRLTACSKSLNANEIDFAAKFFEQAVSLFYVKLSGMVKWTVGAFFVSIEKYVGRRISFNKRN